MSGILLHLGLFVISCTIIVAVSCMFADAEDGDAWKAFPKRWLSFMVGCALVVGVMLLFEHTFASVN